MSKKTRCFRCGAKYLGLENGANLWACDSWESQAGGETGRLCKERVKGIRLKAEIAKLKASERDVGMAGFFIGSGARGELISAAKAVIERWDSPNWKDQPHTGEFIHRLRQAVEKAEGRK